MLDIKKLKMENLQDYDIEHIEALTKVVNNFRMNKDEFDNYVNIMLEREEFGRAYEDDCANGTLLVIFYHQDYLDEFKENHKEDLENGAIYIVENKNMKEVIK